MADVVYLGTGPVINEPPPGAGQLLPANLIEGADVLFLGPLLEVQPENPEVTPFVPPIEQGDLLGQVLNFDLTQELPPIIDGPSVTFEFFPPGLLFPPASLAPQTVGDRQGPLFPRTVYAAGTSLYIFVPDGEAMYAFLGGRLPGTQLFSAAVFGFANQVVAADAEVVFTESVNVNPALRGQKFLVNEYEVNVDPGDGSTRLEIKLTSALPAVPGLYDQFFLQSRSPTRNTPGLEIILY